MLLGSDSVEPHHLPVLGSRVARHAGLLGPRYQGAYCFGHIGEAASEKSQRSELAVWVVRKLYLIMAEGLFREQQYTDRD